MEHDHQSVPQNDGTSPDSMWRGKTESVATRVSSDAYAETGDCTGLNKAFPSSVSSSELVPRDGLK